MKILVLQLARFGDIYLTWPILRALRRKHPGAEIQLLVRERFVAATEGLGADITVLTMPTAKILGPILNQNDQGGVDALEEWLQPFLNMEWDQVINLSFSPVSSYLTEMVSGINCDVRGYTRHEDGYLSIPDDASAYFYAQVGPNRFNRFHLIDILAMVADVELENSDWGWLGEKPKAAVTADVIVHLGASQSEKCYPVHHWRSVLEKLSAQGMRVALIGSENEMRLTGPLSDLPNVENFVGKTRISDLFSMIANARLLVGADSAPIHIAAHVGTPVLNLSFSSVSFWETGPTSKGSRVLVGLTPESLTPAKVGAAIQAMIAGRPIDDGIKGVTDVSGPRFEAEDLSFPWRVILALYTHSDYPLMPNDSVVESSILRLQEVTGMAIEQLQQWKKNPNSKSANEILSSVDIVLREIPKLAPAISPIVFWFETERLRIPPGEKAATFSRTAALFQDFATILSVFTSRREANLDTLRQDGLGRIVTIELELAECARSFRHFQPDVAEPVFQKLLEHLTFFEINGLHHLDLTKVQGAGVGADMEAAWNKAYESYHEVLRLLVAAFEKQDYLYVADLLEFEIASCVGQWRTQLVKWHDVVLT